jgi:hypothetical protein
MCIAMNKTGNLSIMLKTVLYKPCTRSRDTSADAVASKYVIVNGT